MKRHYRGYACARWKFFTPETSGGDFYGAPTILSSMFLVLKNETKFPIRLKRCSFVENRRAVEKKDSFVISICFRRVLREWFLYHENSKLELLSESNFRTNFLHERANSSCKNSRLEIVGKRKGGKCWSEWLLFKYLKKLNRVEEGNKDANERSRAGNFIEKYICSFSKISKIVEQLETNDTALSFIDKYRVSKHSFIVEGIEVSYVIQVKERERERR